MNGSRHDIVRWIVCGMVVCGCAGMTLGVEFAGGTGEPNDPYQIATAEQLASIGSDADLLDRHFVLVSDIDLDPNLPEGRVFDGSLIAPNPEYSINEACPTFTGVFNGNGHAIRNLTIHASPTSNRASMFGLVGRGGRVQALWLENVFIKGGYRVGALAGENWGTISHCHVTGTIRGRDFAGGLVGANGSLRVGREGGDTPRNALPLPDSVEGLIYACSVDVEVSGEMGVDRGRSNSSYIGGLVGRNSGGMVYACRAAGNVRGELFIGGIVGVNITGWIRSSYAENRVYAGRYAGGVVGSNSGNILFCYTAGPVDANDQAEAGGISGAHSNSTYLCCWDVQASGCARSYGGKARTTGQMRTRETFRGWGYDNQWVLADAQDYPRLAWEGSPGIPLVDEPVPYDVGAGTAEDPYQISTAEQFLALGYSWPFFDKHFVLTADIDLTGIDPNIAAAAGTCAIPFSGSFDGMGYIITGFRLWSPHERHVGVFGYITMDGLLSNVAVLDSDVRGLSRVGTLAGFSEGTILNCRTEGSVSGDSAVGGLLGVNDPNGSLVACMSSGEISATMHAGGLVGTSAGSVSNCHSSASVTTTGEFAAGLVAINDGLISSSCSRGTVRGGYGAGGFVGYNGAVYRHSLIGEVLDCYSTATVEGTKKVAGFIGVNTATTRRCYAAGVVRYTETGGGFVGFQQNDGYYHPFVEACYWDAEASDAETSAAGTGMTTEQMRRQASFSGWDFENVWMICEGQDYPRLQWENVGCGDEPIAANQ